ncbi:hypothetical protein EHS13_09915 [Paenibacillus psychroresistens]|uniref:Thioredoxin domain-containing protein n=1 Tax=Paenibacillus psychroresistens TaxID=1778678 RepID=A0A6B8RIK3_9BACL|nr:hypothetical protein [Paenibacillus psychroresistens]QGQ95178.1 hypothetical protein EHS13_09915 [Paenibacillus psychroresistens]
MGINQLALIMQYLVLLLLAVAITQVYQRSTRRELAHSNHGFPKGMLFPKLQITTVSGQEFPIIRPRTEGTIVAFTSTTCKYCASLYPLLTPFQHKQPQLKVLVLIAGSLEDTLAKAKEFNLNELVVSSISFDQLTEFGTKLVPFAYFLGADGKVLAQGGVQTENDLQLLLESARTA